MTAFFLHGPSGTVLQYGGWKILPAMSQQLNYRDLSLVTFLVERDSGREVRSCIHGEHLAAKTHIPDANLTTSAHLLSDDPGGESEEVPSLADGKRVDLQVRLVWDLDRGDSDDSLFHDIDADDEGFLVRLVLEDEEGRVVIDDSGVVVHDDG